MYNAYEIPKFTLSWNHYQILMRIANLEERNFYEIEAQQQGWDYRWLQRQVGSSLYERLALSRNKNEVMRLATEGQVVEKPADIIKSPISLEFIGLKPDSSYSESTLENAIIDKMQTFLLEMEKGFCLKQDKNVLRLMKIIIMLIWFYTIVFCNAIASLT